MGRKDQYVFVSNSKKIFTTIETTQKLYVLEQPLFFTHKKIVLFPKNFKFLNSYLKLIFSGQWKEIEKVVENTRMSI